MELAAEATFEMSEAHVLTSRRLSFAAADDPHAPIPFPNQLNRLAVAL